jgi:hypothetical protein
MTMPQHPPIPEMKTQIPVAPLVIPDPPSREPRVTDAQTQARMQVQAGGNSMFAPMPRPKPPTQVKRRSGTMSAIIGSNYMIYRKTDRGMKPAQFEVRAIDAMEKTHPGIIDRSKAMCLHCGRTWDSAEIMKAEHPSEKDLIDRDEPHVFALWSDEPLDPDEPNGLVVGLMSNLMLQAS